VRTTADPSVLGDKNSVRGDLCLAGSRVEIAAHQRRPGVNCCSLLTGRGEGCGPLLSSLHATGCVKGSVRNVLKASTSRLSEPG
jgi:hypothetical protein